MMFFNVNRLLIIKLTEWSIENLDEDAENGERAPLLFVDVNLGVNRSERIVVYEGDSSEELADKFSQLHSINFSLKKMNRI